jgi:hypothetical protein
MGASTIPARDRPAARLSHVAGTRAMPCINEQGSSYGTTETAIKGGNAQSGSLTTLYSGSLPSGYDPMDKQGGIILVSVSLGRHLVVAPGTPVGSPTQPGDGDGLPEKQEAPSIFGRGLLTSA